MTLTQIARAPPDRLAESDVIKQAAYRRTLGFALAMLIVQFLLGTAVNLFVKIPADPSGANPPEYFGDVVTSVFWAILHGGLSLTLFAAFGLVLVLAALGTLVQAAVLAVADGSRWPRSGSSACWVPASTEGAS